MLKLGYARSSFRNFGSYLSNVVGLNENDIQLFSKLYTSYLSPMKYLQAFTQLEEFQSPFTTWGTIGAPHRLNMMTLA